jgi:pyridoxal phosphate enzyme (YggS family)
MAQIADKIREVQLALPDHVKLLVVSKYQSVNALLDAYHAGQRRFGENRVRELADKYTQLPKDVEWHFIGNLQKNKVKYIAPFVHTIHSIDSVELLQEVERQAAKCDRIVYTLLEVHVAQESSKHGFSPDQCREILQSKLVQQLEHVRIAGLMGMATNTSDLDQVRLEFSYLHSLFNELKSIASPDFTELSMGMSNDYKIAVQEGTTIVRIGSYIFE